MSRHNHFIGETDSILASMEEYLTDLYYKEWLNHSRKKHRSRYKDEIPSYSHYYLRDYLNPRYNSLINFKGDFIRTDRELIDLRQEIDNLYSVFLERSERMSHMELMFRKTIYRVSCDINTIEDQNQKLSIIEARILEKLGNTSLANSITEYQKQLYICFS